MCVIERATYLSRRSCTPRWMAWFSCATSPPASALHTFFTASWVKEPGWEEAAPNGMDYPTLPYRPRLRRHVRYHTRPRVMLYMISYPAPSHDVYDIIPGPAPPMQAHRCSSVSSAGSSSRTVASRSLRDSSRKAGSRLGPARVVGNLAWPRHTNGTVATAPLDLCARRISAPKGK